jgi:uncharacterized protein (TIGR01619 family)
MKIVYAILLSIGFILPGARSQPVPEDWDNYIISVNNHPVSIVVNLALKEKAPLKERPFVIILRTKYNLSDPNGFPAPEISGTLDSIEFDLEARLKSSHGAIYAGRFTQRGLREFYFYALDTVQYLAACASVMDHYRSFPWLSKALADKTWSNYFEVLYPGAAELEKIENRRMIETLKQKGDPLKTARKIDHVLYFKTPSGRQSFLRALELTEVAIDEMPAEKTEWGEYGFRLKISRSDIPDNMTMNKLTIYLTELSSKYSGIYGGWQTYVIKN